MQDTFGAQPGRRAWRAVQCLPDLGDRAGFAIVRRLLLLMPAMFLVAALVIAVAFVTDQPLSPKIPRAPDGAKVRAMSPTTPPDQGRPLTLVDGRSGRGLDGGAQRGTTDISKAAP